ncbi:hypothetical protein ACOMHN_036451 [Nucella lapillus]
MVAGQPGVTTSVDCQAVPLCSQAGQQGVTTSVDCQAVPLCSQAWQPGVTTSVDCQAVPLCSQARQPGVTTSVDCQAVPLCSQAGQPGVTTSVDCQAVPLCCLCVMSTRRKTEEEEPRYGPVIRFIASHDLLGFYGLPLVSQILSAIIASERCFCVVWPLRSHSFLSTSTTTAVIVVIAVTIPCLYSLVVSAFRTVCVRDPLTNSDTWVIIPSQFFRDNQKLMNILNVYVFGVGIPGVMMAVVVVTTIVTMVKLRQAAAWRAGTSSSGSVASRDVGVTVMLVYNSIFFIVCVFPAALKRMSRVLIPELGVGKQQHNLSIMFNWLMELVEYINATFNIVIYYTKGSRYRQTFRQIMGTGRKTAGLS